jgi:hypothetical protein
MDSRRATRAKTASDIHQAVAAKALIHPSNVYNRPTTIEFHFAQTLLPCRITLKAVPRRQSLASGLLLLGGSWKKMRNRANLCELATVREKNAITGSLLWTTFDAGTVEPSRK